MRFNQAALILGALAAAPVHSFIVAGDSADGVFRVSYNDIGEPLVEKVSEIDASLVNPKTEVFPRLDRRQRRLTICNSNNELNYRDTDAAVNNLDAQCGGDAGKDVPGGWDFYAKIGSTVAYFCNFGGNNRCDAGSRRSTSRSITDTCGSYKPGWVEFPDWAISYGYDFVNTNFCGRHPS